MYQICTHSLWNLIVNKQYSVSFAQINGIANVFVCIKIFDLFTCVIIFHTIWMSIIPAIFQLLQTKYKIIVWNILVCYTFKNDQTETKLYVKSPSITMYFCDLAITLLRNRSPSPRKVCWLFSEHRAKDLSQRHEENQYGRTKGNN